MHSFVFGFVPKRLNKDELCLKEANKDVRCKITAKTVNIINNRSALLAKSIY